jgi:hypothetical protein
MLPVRTLGPVTACVLIAGLVGIVRCRNSQLSSASKSIRSTSMSLNEHTLLRIEISISVPVSPQRRETTADPTTEKGVSSSYALDTNNALIDAFAASQQFLVSIDDCNKKRGATTSSILLAEDHPVALHWSTTTFLHHHHHFDHGTTQNSNRGETSSAGTWNAQQQQALEIFWNGTGYHELLIPSRPSAMALSSSDMTTFIVALWQTDRHDTSSRHLLARRLVHIHPSNAVLHLSLHAQTSIGVFQQQQQQKVTPEATVVVLWYCFVKALQLGLLCVSVFLAVVFAAFWLEREEFTFQRQQQLLVQQCDQGIDSPQNVARDTSKGQDDQGDGQEEETHAKNGIKPSNEEERYYETENEEEDEFDSKDHQREDVNVSDEFYYFAMPERLPREYHSESSSDNEGFEEWLPPAMPRRLVHMEAYNGDTFVAAIEKLDQAFRQCGSPTTMAINRTNVGPTTQSAISVSTPPTLSRRGDISRSYNEQPLPVIAREQKGTNRELEECASVKDPVVAAASATRSPTIFVCKENRPVSPSAMPCDSHSIQGAHNSSLTRTNTQQQPQLERYTRQTEVRQDVPLTIEPQSNKQGDLLIGNVAVYDDAMGNGSKFGETFLGHGASFDRLTPDGDSSRKMHRDRNDHLDNSACASAEQQNREMIAVDVCDTGKVAVATKSSQIPNSVFQRVPVQRKEVEDLELSPFDHQDSLTQFQSAIRGGLSNGGSVVRLACKAAIFSEAQFGSSTQTGTLTEIPKSKTTSAKTFQLGGPNVAEAPSGMTEDPLLDDNGVTKETDPRTLKLASPASAPRTFDTDLKDLKRATTGLLENSSLHRQLNAVDGICCAVVDHRRSSPASHSKIESKEQSQNNAACVETEILKQMTSKEISKNVKLKSSDIDNCDTEMSTQNSNTTDIEIETVTPRQTLAGVQAFVATAQNVEQEGIRTLGAGIAEATEITSNSLSEAFVDQVQSKTDRIPFVDERSLRMVTASRSKQQNQGTEDESLTSDEFTVNPKRLEFVRGPNKGVSNPLSERKRGRETSDANQNVSPDASMEQAYARKSRKVRSSKDVEKKFDSPVKQNGDESTTHKVGQHRKPYTRKSKLKLEHGPVVSVRNDDQDSSLDFQPAAPTVTSSRQRKSAPMITGDSVESSSNKSYVSTLPPDSHISTDDDGSYGRSSRSTFWTSSDYPGTHDKKRLVLRRPSKKEKSPAQKSPRKDDELNFKNQNEDRHPKKRSSSEKGDELGFYHCSTDKIPELGTGCIDSKSLGLDPTAPIKCTNRRPQRMQQQSSDTTCVAMAASRTRKDSKFSLIEGTSLICQKSVESREQTKNHCSGKILDESFLSEPDGLLLGDNAELTRQGTFDEGDQNNVLLNEIDVVGTQRVAEPIPEMAVSFSLLSAAETISETGWIYGGPSPERKPSRPRKGPKSRVPKSINVQTKRIGAGLAVSSKKAKSR